MSAFRFGDVTIERDNKILDGVIEKTDGLLAAWLVSDDRDGEIQNKEAVRELVRRAQRHRLVLLEEPVREHRAVQGDAHDGHARGRLRERRSSPAGR